MEQQTEKTLIEIDWSGLEEFRKTLPEYRRREHYRFFVAEWDIVRVQYILEQRPREQRQLRLANAPKVYGFEDLENSVYQINPAAAEDERVDLSRPVIIAVFNGDEGKDEQLMIDGLHRVYKGWKNGVEKIPCYILTPEEEQLCRVR